ncbi:hydroxyacylglutathione hydrolase [Roseateles koreensis]|uniref:Hydroxyacylglutathione hydrolase n=1 Tax=Roseateles koreensis TaxID=2987526 RepID=A0ABT5KRE6_9BURK|nr:hydroxyacylglutathione hydrolase [Roseateles koreensis]
MSITAIPAFADNYIWMLDDGRQAIVVDPGDAAPVIEALATRSLSLIGILVTHHHADHVGGVDALRGLLRGPVYGPARENIPIPFIPLQTGDAVDLLGLSFKVIDVPGHTAGHIAYFAEGAGLSIPDPALFCGDTLFSGGCGRLFEGTAAQMHASLQTLAALPAQTRVFCTHEYTLSNLRFALAIEPANPALLAYQEWAQAQRECNLPTLPSTLKLELQINPFLRCGEPQVVAAALHHQPSPEHGRDGSPLATFARLRQWKNDFR